MKPRYSDEILLEGLRQGKTNVLEYLYSEFTPVVRHLVRKNSGTQHEIEDLFQDALMILFRRCKEKNFCLKCSLKTYFIAICKNLWMQRLERKYRLLFQAHYEAHEERCAYIPEERTDSELMLERERLMHKNIKSLPPDCQRILKLYINKIPYAEIARLLQVKDEIYVKTRKYTCKNLLRKKIMNDPDCKQFFYYE